MDFRKVVHMLLDDSLISKPEKCVLDKTALRWIYNWLSNHRQRVIIDKSM